MKHTVEIEIPDIADQLASLSDKKALAQVKLWLSARTDDTTYFILRDWLAEFIRCNAITQPSTDCPLDSTSNQPVAAVIDIDPNSGGNSTAATGEL